MHGNTTATPSPTQPTPYKYPGDTLPPSLTSLRSNISNHPPVSDITVSNAIIYTYSDHSSALRGPSHDQRPRPMCRHRPSITYNPKSTSHQNHLASTVHFTPCPPHFHRPSLASGRVQCRRSLALFALLTLTPHHANHSSFDAMCLMRLATRTLMFFKSLCESVLNCTHWERETDV